MSQTRTDKRHVWAKAPRGRHPPPSGGSPGEKVGMVELVGVIDHTCGQYIQPQGHDARMTHLHGPQQTVRGEVVAARHGPQSRNCQLAHQVPHQRRLQLRLEARHSCGLGVIHGGGGGGGEGIEPEGTSGPPPPWPYTPRTSACIGPPCGTHGTGHGAMASKHSWSLRAPVSVPCSSTRRATLAHQLALHSRPEGMHLGHDGAKCHRVLRRGHNPGDAFHICLGTP